MCCLKAWPRVSRVMSFMWRQKNNASDLETPLSGRQNFQTAQNAQSKDSVSTEYQSIPENNRGKEVNLLCGQWFALHICNT